MADHESQAAGDRPKRDEPSDFKTRLARLAARGEPRRMMTVEERLAFFDSIRSKSVAPAEDTTPLIRRDRDER